MSVDSSVQKSWVEWIYQFSKYILILFKTNFWLQIQHIFFSSFLKAFNSYIPEELFDITKEIAFSSDIFSIAFRIK